MSLPLYPPQGSGSSGASIPTTLTGETIDAGLNTIKETLGIDAYVYIDVNDSNKIKGIINRTGTVYSDPTNADAVMNSVINDLSANSNQQTTAGALQYLWTGGQYGVISVGPGTFNVADSIILKSNITIIGSGPWATTFKLVAQHADNATSTVMKGSKWDTLSAPNTPTASQQQQGDKGVRLMHFAIDGNRINNQSTITTVPTYQFSGGVESIIQSWGHGIAWHGAGLLIDDVWVQFCRGAGIIVQDGSQNLGGITGTSPTALETHGDPWCAKIRDVYVRGNDQQGVLVRGPLVTIKGITTCFNGEGGIDVQNSAYFGGGLWDLSDGILFLDCANHQNDDMSTYNPRLYELRLGSGVNHHVHDIWIEGPYGPGDCLHLGIETNPANASGNTLAGSMSFSNIEDIIMDNIHWNAIYLGFQCYRNKIQGVRIKSQNETTNGLGQNSQFQNGVQCNGQFGNWIEFQIRDLPGPADTTNHHPALVMGDGSNIAFDNHVKMSAMSCQYDLKWGNAGNYGNTVEIVHTYKTDFAASVALLDPNGTTIDYTKNNIKILSVPNNTASNNTGFMGRNGGLATITTDSSTTQFTIAHGLYATPNWVSVTPQTADARGDFYVTVDATNITVTYPTAPPTGTNKLWWVAQVNFQ